MCGIWCVLGYTLPAQTASHLVSKLSARGPEGSRVVEGTDFQLGFTRLAINGLDLKGMQPMRLKNLTWACNGEIYNSNDISRRFAIESNSGSDCEVLGPFFEKIVSQTNELPSFFKALDGVFSMILVDSNSGLAFVGRDPYGVRPLFVGYILGGEFDDSRASILNSSGVKVPIASIVFSSELKALPADCALVEHFPPGHYAAYDLKTLHRVGFEAYHTVPWMKLASMNTTESACAVLRDALKESVHKRMMTERPVAALLSGGLDSSLIAALVQEELKQAGAEPLRTFSIGFKGSEDLRCARIVAEHIGSNHTEIVMTPDEFFAAIPEVIRSIESYDITTIRASVGNYLVSKAIKDQTDCKVVFNGDGSDEVLGGYMYFYNAPSDEAFEAETQRLLKDIHLFDVLRSDRSISSHGLEARTPFLDKQFVAVAQGIATQLRRPVKGSQCEKWILRKAFDNFGLLPQEILWRKKEAFSDGVSGSKEKSWYQICQEKSLEEVGEDWVSKASSFVHLTPQTAEAYYYRVLFDRFYRNAQTAVVPYHWMPKWSPGATDPSARTLEVYTSA